METMGLIFNLCFYKIAAWLFRKNTMLEVNDWPKNILLKMFFLQQKYIREFCCYCQKTLSYSRSTKNGDSGGICPKCFRQQCPEAFEDMKAEGKLTAEQIAEAEGNTP